MIKPRKKIRYGRRLCRICGDRVTKNALGFAAHQRWCQGRPRSEIKLVPYRPKDEVTT